MSFHQLSMAIRAVSMGNGTGETEKCKTLPVAYHSRCENTSSDAALLRLPWLAGGEVINTDLGVFANVFFPTVIAVALFGIEVRAG